MPTPLPGPTDDINLAPPAHVGSPAPLSEARRRELEADGWEVWDPPRGNIIAHRSVKLTPEEIEGIERELVALGLDKETLP